MLGQIPIFLWQEYIDILLKIDTTRRDNRSWAPQEFWKAYRGKGSSR